jgi:hypothetical protein
VAGSANPDASRSALGRQGRRRRRLRPWPWRRRRRSRTASGASAGSDQRAPCDPHGCAGNAARRRAGLRGGPCPSRRGCSTAGRGRSGCKAAPAHGSARTRTNGRDDRRPGSPGRLPRNANGRPQAVCTAACSGIHFARIPLLGAVVGHGVGLEQPRDGPAPCPPTTQARRGSTSPAGHSQPPTDHTLLEARHAAALQGGRMGISSSPTTITTDRRRPAPSSPPALHRA